MAGSLRASTGCSRAALPSSQERMLSTAPIAHSVSCTPSIKTSRRTRCGARMARSWAAAVPTSWATRSTCSSRSSSSSSSSHAAWLSIPTSSASGESP